MSARSTSWFGRRAGIAALLVLTLTAPCVPSARALVTEQGAAPASRHATRGKRSALEQRVELLTKALHLDTRQQLEVRKILLREREQVRAAWNDPSVPAAHRVGATQAIGDRTADQIRALLSDEQKKSYKPPRQVHEPAGSSRTVEEWMANQKAK